MPTERKIKKPTPFNVPTDLPPPSVGAVYGLVTAPPAIGTVTAPVIISPSLLQPLSVTPEPEDNLTPLADNVTGSESSDKDNPVNTSSDNSEVSEGEYYSTSVGPN